MEKTSIEYYDFDALVPGEKNIIPKGSNVHLLIPEITEINTNLSSVFNHNLKKANIPEKQWFASIFMKAIVDEMTGNPNISTISLTDSVPGKLRINEISPKRICSFYKADMVISMEQYDIVIDISAKDAGFNWDVNSPYFVASGYVNILFRLNYFKRDGTKDQIELKHKERYFSGKTFDHAQDIQDNIDYRYILEETAQTYAVKFTRLISPSWQTISRPFYGYLKKDFSMAYRELHNNNWQEALEIWEEICKSDNEKFRKYAMFNIILGHELVGNLDSAIYTAKKHLEIYNSELTRNYLDALQHRSKQIEIVEKQLNVN